MVLDTSGSALAACRGAQLFMIKASLSELAGVVGHAVDDDTTMEAAARQLITQRYADHIVVSLGARGALLVTAADRWRIPTAAVATQSAVGAGDAMVGAMILALDRGRRLSEALRCGVAAGAAALLAPGTQLVNATDFERLLQQIPVATASNHRMAS
jgi:6-phosphofructokinase 2